MTGAADSCIPASIWLPRDSTRIRLVICRSCWTLSDSLTTQVETYLFLLHYFSDLFVQNEVDLAMFTTLKDEDFISIGIRSFGARKIMLNAIQGNLIFPPL
jgi:hypothetical protein